MTLVNSASRSRIDGSSCGARLRLTGISTSDFPVPLSLKIDDVSLLSWRAGVVLMNREGRALSVSSENRAGLSRLDLRPSVVEVSPRFGLSETVLRSSVPLEEDAPAECEDEDMDAAPTVSPTSLSSLNLAVANEVADPFLLRAPSLTDRKDEDCEPCRERD